MKIGHSDVYLIAGMLKTWVCRKGEFEKLQKALADQKQILEKSRKTNKLTKAEEQVITTMSDALSASLKRVKKEIEDVEDIVD